MVNEFVAEPTDRKYKFRATIQSKKVWVLDQNEQGHESKYEATICYLIPEPCDESSGFFAAWLPDFALEPGKPVDENVKHEVALLLGSPLNGPCRGAVMRGNYQNPVHHIMVMSVGVEDDINRKGLSGTKIMVTALSEKDEGLAEVATDTSRDMRASE